LRGRRSESSEVASKQQPLPPPQSFRLLLVPKVSNPVEVTHVEFGVDVFSVLFA
jgi:hypothetical protein